MAEAQARFRPDRSFARPWGTFSYADEGGGAPVVLLHGTGGSRHDWEGVLPSLDGYRCIRPDLRGHGGSAVPRDYFSLRDLVEDVLVLADRLWLGRFRLVGHGMGGMVALKLLRRVPSRIDRVALVESWVDLDRVAAMPGAPDACPVPVLAERIRRVHRETLVRWMPGVREDFLAWVRAAKAERLLRETAHPVLALYGDRGGPRPAAEALGLPSRPEIRLVWLEGRGHYPHLECPEETGRLVRRFLDGDAEGGKGDEPDGPPPTLLDLALGTR